MRTLLSILVAVAVTVVAPLPATSAAPGATPAACKPIEKNWKKAVKAKKKAKAKKLRASLNSCKTAANGAAAVRAQLAGYTFTGTRGDGEPVSVTLCANGKWSSATGAGSVGVSTGTSWFVRNLQFTNATAWTAQVGENADRAQGGWGIGMGRKGAEFQVGIASFDSVSSLGAVTRSSGAATCASL